MNESMLVLTVVGFMIAAVIGIAFMLGRADLAKVKRDLVTSNSVRHNLNCLVGDLRHEVRKFKPDALAFNALKGQWTTRNVELVKYNAQREKFYCIGFPERTL